MTLSGSSVDINDAEIAQGAPFSFSVSTPVDDRLWIFQASTAREMYAWMDALKDAAVHKPTAADLAWGQAMQGGLGRSPVASSFRRLFG